MPKFLRIITGDAKSFTNGTANANASWSCTGFENRQLKDKYPLCPRAARWCAPSSSRAAGTARTSTAPTTAPTWRSRTPTAPARGLPGRSRSWSSGSPTTPCRRSGRGPFAVDCFPEQLHKPITDHGDFINVMPERLMQQRRRLHQQRPPLPLTPPAGAGFTLTGAEPVRLPRPSRMPGDRRFRPGPRAATPTGMRRSADCRGSGSAAAAAPAAAGPAAGCRSDPRGARRGAAARGRSGAG